MIILKVKAGLGNQMFQYAYVRALQLRSEKFFGISIPLKLDLTWFKEQHLTRDTKRAYELCYFNIKEEVATESDICAHFGYVNFAAYKLAIKIIRKIQREIFGLSDYVFYPRLAQPIQKAYIDSYFWNSEKYFKDFEDTIRKEFTLKAPMSKTALEVVQEIESDRQSGNIPVLICVRRGDYATNPVTQAYNGTKDLNWYKNVVEALRLRLGDDAKKISLWVASDDTAWVKNNLILTAADGIRIPLHIISRPGLAAHEELVVVGSCSHFIIANSTFHWWAAWLSKTPDKIIIGPGKWLNNSKIKTTDVMPSEWIRM